MMTISKVWHLKYERSAQDCASIVLKVEFRIWFANAKMSPTNLNERIQRACSYKHISSDVSYVRGRAIVERGAGMLHVESILA